jgi:uroporphyrin-III C-methyltransferase
MNPQMDLFGKVYLVGAGPGDPGLLTVKAKSCLEIADVVIYDRLVTADILQLAKAEAEMIYVGKEPNHHVVRQREIEKIMIEKAQAGRMVVRLKGGDPFVFGRGAEEAAALKKENISFEVIPGVTSAIGALAYAGIPVTHRDFASGFHVVTGHECLSSTGVNWGALTESNHTLVILMGLLHLREIATKLMLSGRSELTPAGVICNGTTENQEVVIGSLGTIADLAEQQSLSSPATIVIGDVVHFARELSWFQGSRVYQDKVDLQNILEG